MPDSRRVVVIGLDGSPYTLIKRYIERGLMPNLAKIVESGSLNQMDTVIPEVSSAAWTSFMTGKRPDNTGIYGFFELQPESYKIKFPSFIDMKEITIWSIINKELRKPSIIINMPSTFPAKSMNGALISGFVSTSLNKSVFPPTLLPELEQIDYKIDINTNGLTKNKTLLVDEAKKFLINREIITNKLWDRYNWKLFTCVITGTDRLQHFMMDDYENDNSPYKKNFEKYYSEIDRFIGNIQRKITENDLLVILSDHGFEETKHEVYLNQLLKEQGFLEKELSTFKDFEEITEKTTVFAQDPGRIYIHDKAKYTKGKYFSDPERQDLLIKLKNIFDNLQSPEGKKVIRELYFKEDIYKGKYKDQAPDLVLVANKGFSLKGSLQSTEIFKKANKHTGHHNYDDAFLALNKNNYLDSKPQIIDIAPTILNYLGINTLKYDFDGKKIKIH